MKTILIAEESERDLVEKYLPGETNILVTGVGAFNILRALRDLPKDTEIINIGYAGSANFDLGSVVEVTESRLNHPNVTYPEPSYRLEPVQDLFFQAINPIHAVCYTNCDFVLQSDYHDCVFDMELAFIIGQGFEHVSAIKIVSDNLSLHTYHETTRGAE